MATLYEQDFSAWLSKQMEFIRKKDFAHLDVEHLLEEMEEMGGSFKSAIESHLVNILLHMLKAKYQPDMACNSWSASMTNSRLAINRIIKHNPSLRRYPQQVLDDCYNDSRKGASKESGIKSAQFPTSCPWTLHQILGE